MLIRTRLSGWIALYADDCGRCCESRRSDRAWDFVDMIISAGQINFRGPGTVHYDCSLEAGEPIPMRKPPTGEPCAGEPHARFGGRGRRKPFPTPNRPGGTGNRLYGD